MRIPFVSLLSFILCYLTIYISVVSGQCREDQQSLLLQLKNLTFEPETDQSSSRLKSWNESIACCQWRGVTCDEERHVIGLDLSKEYISGGLDNSSSLFGLQHLQHLNLALNDFSSTIPSSFSKLQNLTYLNLSYAAFVGQVPTEISQLTGLITLDLSITELEISSLKELIQNFTKIRQLYLDGVRIYGQEWQAALLQIPTLQELSMAGCELSGPLHSSLSRLDNLSVIILDSNNLGSVVPETFANFRNLTTLSLEGCELVGTFPQKIFKIPTLSFIDISDNFDLHGSFPEFPLNGSLKTLSVSSTSFSGQLPNSIGNLRHLSSLDLSSSQFNGSPPNSISNLTQLVDLDLSWNNFTGSIPSFGMCSELQSIDLSHNFFTGALPNSLSTLTQLVHLDLSWNNFTGSIPSLGMCKKLISIELSSNFFTGAISSAKFEDLVNLVSIYLYNNSFTGMIPSSIFILPSLQFIDLSNNEFEGQLNNSINASSTIQLLDLSMNHLEGPIPIALFQLTNLRYLILSSNKFSGTIEVNMLNKLVNLTELDISYNNLTIIETSTPLTPFPLLPSLISVGLASCKLTSFPQFLKNFSYLGDIDLSNNHISGTIPQWIWSNNYINLSHNYLTNWEEPVLNNTLGRPILDLHSNLLQGPPLTLPQSFSYLDFSNNNLSSIIPSNIGEYLFETAFISFASNNLQGHIPESICNAPYLQVLDLSNNSLTGTIPKCLIAMNGTLSILDLGKNKLDGTVDTFPGLCSLKTLHLNGNSLQGKLPKYLANCAKLEILDIGDNRIHDQFPCWLKNISTLHVLILRSNRLHGSLKCGGTKVAWPHLQIFDLASNIFGGRIPFSFFETWKVMIANEKDESKSKLGHLQFEPSILQGGPFKIPNYQDRVTVTIKEHQMELVKILTIFTTIDLSCNKFEGVIPEGLGQLNFLYILNLSHNSFSGSIPSSFGNMKELESLDLSYNNLRGKVPPQIAKLSFLSSLNVSYNHLAGRIPTGTQIQSFSADSFKGNDGLCGPPLSHCRGDGVQGTIYPASNSKVDAKKSIDWNFISIELGFTFGIGIVILPLVFYKSWRMRYWKCVDDILYRTFPHMVFVYERRGGQSYRTLRWKA